MAVKNATLEIRESDFGNTAVLEVYAKEGSRLGPDIKMIVDKNGAKISGDEIPVEDASAMLSNALKSGFVDAEKVDEALALLNDAQQDSEWSW